jgi:hypothetical protein
VVNWIAKNSLKEKPALMTGMVVQAIPALAFEVESDQTVRIKHQGSLRKDVITSIYTYY